MCSKMCSKFLGTISGISTINRGRAVSGFREQMQVRTQFACAPVMAAPKRESDAPLQQLVGGSCRLQAPTRRRANATEGKGAFELLPSARPTHALVLNRYPPPALPGERPLWRQRMARVGCPSTTVVGPFLPFALVHSVGRLENYGPIFLWQVRIMGRVLPAWRG